MVVVVVIVHGRLGNNNYNTYHYYNYTGVPTYMLACPYSVMMNNNFNTIFLVANYYYCRQKSGRYVDLSSFLFKTHNIYLCVTGNTHYGHVEVHIILFLTH